MEEHLPSAAGPLLMHAGDCFEFRFLPPPATTDQLSGYCLWIGLAMGACRHAGQGTVLENGSGKGQQDLTELTPRRRDCGNCRVLQPVGLGRRRGSERGPQPRELGQTGKETQNW